MFPHHESSIQKLIQRFRDADGVVAVDFGVLRVVRAPLFLAFHTPHTVG